MDDNNMLDEAIERGLVRVENSKSTEDYETNVKAVVSLMDVKNQQDRIQNEYYLKNDENANKAAEIDNQIRQTEQESKWYNKLSPNTVLTCVTGVVLTGITALAEHDGKLIRFSDIGRGFLSLVTRRND